MKWIYKDETKIYDDNDVFVDERGIEHKDKASVVGMRPVFEEVRPSDIENRVYGQKLQIIDGVPTLSYEFSPRPAEELKQVQDFHKRKAALAEMATLDQHMPRGVEDLMAVMSMNHSVLPAEQQTRLARKAELRQILADTKYLTEGEGNAS